MFDTVLELLKSLLVEPSWDQKAHHDGESDWSIDHPVGYGVVVCLPTPENTTNNHNLTNNVAKI